MNPSPPRDPSAPEPGAGAAFAPEDPPATHRVSRRLIVLGLLRAVFNVVVLVTLYYVLPLKPDGPLPVTLLVGGLVLFTGLAVWQVRAILGAGYPGLRAIEALSLVIPLYLVLFAAAYYLMSQAVPASFNVPLTRNDSIYFVVTVFATVGFGDIVATSQAARIVVTIQMIGNLLVLGVLLRTVLGAVRLGRSRRDPAGSGRGIMDLTEGEP